MFLDSFFLFLQDHFTFKRKFQFSCYPHWIKARREQKGSNNYLWLVIWLISWIMNCAECNEGSPILTRMFASFSFVFGLVGMSTIWRVTLSCVHYICLKCWLLSVIKGGAENCLFSNMWNGKDDFSSLTNDWWKTFTDLTKERSAVNLLSSHTYYECKKVHERIKGEKKSSTNDIVMKTVDPYLTINLCWTTWKTLDLILIVLMQQLQVIGEEEQVIDKK